jgi:hypothetical protein
MTIRIDANPNATMNLLGIDFPLRMNFKVQDTHFSPATQVRHRVGLFASEMRIAMTAAGGLAEQ